MNLEAASQSITDYFTATEFGDDCATPYEPILLLLLLLLLLLFS
jgi:hypothetical protein